MDGTVLPIEITSPWYSKDQWVLPAVSASAVRDKGGVAHVALANADPNRSITVTTTLTGLSATRATGQILTAPAINAINTFDAPNAVVPAAFNDARVDGGRLTVTLPAKSVVMLDLN